jgi:hypothetical protein
MDQLKRQITDIILEESNEHKTSRCPNCNAIQLLEENKGGLLFHTKICCYCNHEWLPDYKL